MGTKTVFVSVGLAACIGALSIFGSEDSARAREAAASLETPPLRSPSDSESGQADLSNQRVPLLVEARAQTGAKAASAWWSAALSEVWSAHRDRRRADFVFNGVARVELLAGLGGSVVLPELPPEFCRFYPAECARIEGSPESSLGDLFAVPGASDFEKFFEDPVVQSTWEESEMLTAFMDAVEDYYTRELDSYHEGKTWIGIYDHLEPWHAKIDSLVTRSDELWNAVQAFGANINNGHSRAISYEAFEERREQTSKAIHAILWEERCQRENRMLAHCSPSSALWMHLSRALTPHFYDESYWYPPDEGTAGSLGLPLYLNHE